MSPRQIFSHSKKISWAYLLVSFLLGILFTFSLLFSKLNLPFKTLNVSNESSQEHESNDYTFTRLKGFEHIRPLISVEPKYESKRFGVLKSKLTDLYAQNEKPAILEVFTPTLQNDKILLQYFKELV